MPISFECDVCFKQYRVPSERAGQKLKCKECGSPLRVPGGNEGVDDFKEAAPMPSRRRPAARKKPAPSGGGSGLLIGLSLAGVLLIGGGVFAAISILKSIPAEPAAAAPSVAAADGNSDANVETVAANAAPAGSAENVIPAAAAVPDAGAAASGSGDSTATEKPDPRPTPRPVAPKIVIPPWGIPAPVEVAEIEWPDRFGRPMRLPPKAESIIVSPASDRYFVVGKQGYDTSKCQLFDLPRGEIVGRVSGPAETANSSHLSHDGTLFANRVLGKKEEGHRFQVWSLESGELVGDFVHGVDFTVHFVEFGPDKSLVVKTIGKVDGTLQSKLSAIDVLDGSTRWTIEDTSWLNEQVYDLTPDGRYLVTVNSSAELTLCDLSDGKLLGQVDVPKSSDSGKSYSFEAIAVAPDAASLVVMGTNSDETRLFEYEFATGKPGDEMAFPGRFHDTIPYAGQFKGAKVQWLPDGSGWFLGGRWLIDRETGRTLWTLKTLSHPNYDILHNQFVRFSVPGGIVIVDGPDDTPQLRFMPVKLDEIRELVQTMEQSEKAVIKPGTAVTLEVQLKSIRFGDAESTLNELREAIIKRLEANELTVEDDQPVKFVLSYSETAGNELTKSDRPFPLPGRGNSSAAENSGNSKIQATRAAVVAALQSADGKTTYWSQVLEVDPSFLIIRGDVSDASAREAMFRMVTEKLQSLSIPYFIEPGRNGTVLPAVTELPYK